MGASGPWAYLYFYGDPGALQCTGECRHAPEAHRTELVHTLHCWPNAPIILRCDNLSVNISGAMHPLIYPYRVITYEVIYIQAVTLN